MRILSVLLLSCSFANAQGTALKAARMYDGKGDRVVAPGLVVVEGARILQVGGAAPANAKVIDLGDATLMPGFIDSHTHITFQPEGSSAQNALRRLQAPVSEQALDAASYARVTLLAMSAAAELLGIAKATGTLEAGKFADGIAVPGDPTREIGQVQKVSFVMKEGVVYKQ